MNATYTNLYSEERIHFQYQKDKLSVIKKELEDFIENIDFINDSNFTKQVLFPYEVKSNNAIEGYNEDLSSIITIINNPFLHYNHLDQEYQRIMNLYRGYQYVLQKPNINDNNLFNLYQVLSKNLLKDDEKLMVGNHYRHNDVYIFFSSIITKKPDLGINPSKVEEYMKVLLDYINSKEENLSSTDRFIKSQIIHFYFVYIHPYFDINGRTARTTSIWYLNNNEAYPYTIFNRGINFNKSEYYNIIRNVKRYHDLTPFLSYMLEHTKLELEKELVIHSIDEALNKKLAPTNKQILQYILSNNGNNTLLDLATIYNRFNPRKKVISFEEELIEPLLNLEVLKRKRDTNKFIASSNCKNFEYSINSNLINNKEKIKRLNLNKYL